MQPKLVLQSHQGSQEVFPTSQKKVTVGIQGIEGCFTHESVLLLSEHLDIEPKQLDFKFLVNAKNVVEAVDKGEIDRGAIAIANSGSGACVFTLQALAEHGFSPVAIYGMEVVQCLISHPNITSIDQVELVFGHPQAIMQCERTFQAKYPALKLKPGDDSDDTALCAKKIANGELPENTAILASQIAAKKYGLNILEYGVHHDPFNITTFLIIKKKD